MQQEFIVLVIDDDDDYQFITKIFLQRAAVGKQIHTAANGLEAIEILRTIATKEEKLPLLIFLDLKMPVMDGFEFLEEASQLPELNLAQCRIYITTSSVLAKDKEKAYRYPIAGFIAKPMTQNVLHEIVSASTQALE